MIKVHELHLDIDTLSLTEIYKHLSENLVKIARKEMHTTSIEHVKMTLCAYKDCLQAMQIIQELNELDVQEPQVQDVGRMRK